MGRVLGIAIWVITILSVLMFTTKRWWFPESISEHGPAVDRQFMITIIVVGISFAAAQSDWAGQSGSIATARARNAPLIRTETTGSR